MMDVNELQWPELGHHFSAFLVPLPIAPRPD